MSMTLYRAPLEQVGWRMALTTLLRHSPAGQNPRLSMPDRAKLRRHRQTKIVATLGPASASPEMLGRLFHIGADVFRLNFFHGSHADHAANIVAVRALERAARRPIGLLADVQGPKLRVGRFAGGRVHLSAGQTFTFDQDPRPVNARRVQLPHPEILSAAASGTTLLLDDGKLRLRVDRARSGHLECEVLVGGPLGDRKGVNVPDMVLSIPALTDKDRSDMASALDQGVDFIGLSFVQRPEDVAEGRAIADGRAWISVRSRSRRRWTSSTPSLRCRTPSWWHAAIWAWSCRLRRCPWHKSVSSAPPVLQAAR